MKRTALRIALAVALIGLGWTVGKGETAQNAQPNFELVVEAEPSGDINVTCAKGCALSWVERGVNPHAQAMPTFTFNCRSALPCSSRKIGGWILR